jgi:glutamate carboxypeptidase
MPLRGLFTGDEEIGSRVSRPVIERVATGMRAVFNAEPGRVNGNVVTGRRGGSFFRVGLTGRASHAGLNPRDGRNAVHEMARKIGGWGGLNDDTADISVSIGLVSGGQAVNTVAPEAEAQIDLRFARHEDGEAAEAAIRAIADDHAEDGLSATVEKMGGFLPLIADERGEALAALYLEAARGAGLDIGAEFTPSCADSGFTASVGAPTLCATGPVGGSVHSPDEWVDLSSMVPRARAVALSVVALGA